MNKLFVVFLFVIINQLSFAQTAEIDSLLHAVTTDIPNRQKVDAFNQVAFKYLGFDSVNTAKYANQAIAIAEKINYREGICDAYYAIGWVTMVFGHHAEAMDLFKKVLEISQQAKYIKGEANANNGLGDANRNMENYSETLDDKTDVYHNIAVVYTDHLHDSKLGMEKESGNYTAAYEDHVRFKSISHSLVNEEQTKRITLLEAVHQFQKERDLIENEKSAISEELRRERIIQYAAIGGVVILLVLLFVLYQFYRVKKESNNLLIAKNAEIQRHRDELAKLNNTKTRFFSIISHDLRSPVNNFLGMFGLIKLHLHEKYQTENDDYLNEMMNHLNNAGDQLTTLLDNLITWALKEEGTMPYKPESLDVHECFVDNNTILEPNALSKQIKLRAKADVSIRVWADKNSLMTILRNLTSNALKFTSPGGTITLSALKTNDTVTISVQDTGVGIEEDKLKTLFEVSEEKVTRGTKGEKGTGVGLNLVHDFVKINKGTIRVSSKVGLGTTFEFQLPAPSLGRTEHYCKGTQVHSGSIRENTNVAGYPCENFEQGYSASIRRSG
jgi:signal transduction histidine kinase